jgi:response regulator RpfG family c-di-GMP phosphodiesterase
VKAICEQLDLTVEERSRMQIAGLLHNLGKLSASDDDLRLLSKDVRSARIEQIKRAEKMIKEVGGLDFVLPGIRGVYERYDGSGVPDGLKGEQIPLMGRIIAVANEFDKMTAITGDEGAPIMLKDALEKLQELSGSKLDRDIVTALMIAYKKGTLFDTPMKSPI